MSSVEVHETVFETGDVDRGEEFKETIHVKVRINGVRVSSMRRRKASH